MAFGDLEIGLSAQLKCRMRTRYTIAVPMYYTMRCGRGHNCITPTVPQGQFQTIPDQGGRVERLALVPPPRPGWGLHSGWFRNAKVDYNIKRFCTHTAPNCPESSIEIKIINHSGNDASGPTINESYHWRMDDGTIKEVPISADMGILATLVVDVDEDCGLCPGGDYPPYPETDSPSDSGGGPVECQCRVTGELGPFTPEDIWVKDPETGDLILCTRWSRVWKQECFDITDPDDDPGHLPGYLGALEGLRQKQADGAISNLQEGVGGGDCLNEEKQRCCEPGDTKKKCCPDVVVSWLDCPNNVSNFTMGSGGGSSHSSDPNDYSTQVKPCEEEEVSCHEDVRLFNIQGLASKGYVHRWSNVAEYEWNPFLVDTTNEENFINPGDGSTQIDFCSNPPLGPWGFASMISNLMIEAILEEESAHGTDETATFEGKSWKDGIKKAAEKNMELCNGYSWDGDIGLWGNHKGLDEAMSDIQLGLCKALACVRPGPNEDDPLHDNVGCPGCYDELINGWMALGAEDDTPMGPGTNFPDLKWKYGPCILKPPRWSPAVASGPDIESHWPGEHQDGPGDPQPCLEWDRINNPYF